MAQPPDISETFVREVDENLRRDRIRDFFKNNGGWIVVGADPVPRRCGGIIWYQQHRVERAEAHVEQLAKIYKDIGTGNTSKVPQQLDDLAQQLEQGGAGDRAVHARGVRAPAERPEARDRDLQEARRRTARFPKPIATPP